MSVPGVRVDAAILGLSRDGTIMPVDKMAIKAIAVSILTALVGVCFTCWLYIIYYSQDGETFRVSLLTSYVVGFHLGATTFAVSRHRGARSISYESLH